MQINLVCWPVQMGGRPESCYRGDVSLCVSVCDSRYCVNHVQSHLHTAVGVVCFGLGQSRHTVVTVPQDLYPPAVVLLQTHKEMDRWLSETTYCSLPDGQRQTH